MNYLQYLEFILPFALLLSFPRISFLSQNPIYFSFKSWGRLHRCEIIHDLGIMETVEKSSKPNGDLLTRAKTATMRAGRQSNWLHKAQDHHYYWDIVIGEFNAVAVVQLKNKAVCSVAVYDLCLSGEP